MYDDKKDDFKLNIHQINFVILVIILGILIFGLFHPPAASPSSVIKGDLYSSLNTKLASHKELVNYTTLYPRITYLTSDYLKNAKSANLDFFKDAQESNYLLEYDSAAAIYDVKKDKIINFVEQEKAPADLLDKLVAHRALAGYKGVTPALARINKDNLEMLRNQSPDIYKDSKIGDYIIRYQDRLILYDYEKDEIIANIPAPQTQAQPQAQQLPQDFFKKLFSP